MLMPSGERVTTGRPAGSRASRTVVVWSASKVLKGPVYAAQQITVPDHAPAVPLDYRA